jgi:hypothetical protein
MSKYILLYQMKTILGCMEESMDFETLEQAKEKAVEKIKAGAINVRIAQEIPMTIEVKILT